MPARKWVFDGPAEAFLDPLAKKERWHDRRDAVHGFDSRSDRVKKGAVLCFEPVALRRKAQLRNRIAGCDREAAVIDSEGRSGKMKGITFKTLPGGVVADEHALRAI